MHPAPIELHLGEYGGSRFDAKDDPKDIDNGLISNAV
jgi:hypothetical protein